MQVGKQLVEDLRRSRRLLQLVNLFVRGNLRVMLIAGSCCVDSYQIWQEQICDWRSVLYRSDMGLCCIKNHAILPSPMSKQMAVMTILIPKTTSPEFEKDTGLPMAYNIEVGKSSRHKWKRFLCLEGRYGAVLAVETGSLYDDKILSGILDVETLVYASVRVMFKAILNNFFWCTWMYLNIVLDRISCPRMSNQLIASYGFFRFSASDIRERGESPEPW